MKSERSARPQRGRCLTIFAVLGPPVAWLVVLAQALLFAEELRLSGDMVENLVMSFLYFSAFGFSLSYLFGVLPSLISGYIYWWIRQTRDAWNSARIMASIGCGIGLIAPITIASTVEAELPAAFSKWPWFVLPGIAAGFVCARVSEIGLAGSSKAVDATRI